MQISKTMEKKETKTGALMIPVSELARQAYNIYMLKPNTTIILNMLKDIYSDGADAGYQKRITQHRNFKAKRDARIKKSTDSLLDHIDDVIHGGLVEKKS